MKELQSFEIHAALYVILMKHYLIFWEGIHCINNVSTFKWLLVSPSKALMLLTSNINWKPRKVSEALVCCWPNYSESHYLSEVFGWKWDTIEMDSWVYIRLRVSVSIISSDVFQKLFFLVYSFCFQFKRTVKLSYEFGHKIFALI